MGVGVEGGDRTGGAVYSVEGRTPFGGVEG